MSARPAGRRRSARRSSPPAGRPTHAPSFAHDLAFNAEDLALPAGLTGRIDPRGLLPATIGTAGLDATLAFDRPWDRAAIEGDNPVLEEVRIKDLSLTWGKLDLRGRGTLAVDAEGYAEGRLDLRARNWRDMIEMAEAAGALDPTLAGAIRAGLELVARLSGDRDALDVPLEFADGRTRLGPSSSAPPRSSPDAAEVASARSTRHRNAGSRPCAGPVRNLAQQAISLYSTTLAPR